MIYYINVNKKRIVGRNNQISTRPLNLEYDVTEVIDFQFIDDNNQLQPLSPNTPGLTLAIGLKQNMPSYDLLALSHDYEIVNGQTLRFTVNTYTVNWLKKINKANTEVFIEISQQSLESKKVWMRDYCYVWPRVWTAGLSPEEIQSKDYWTASETQEYVDNAIEGISGFVTEEQFEEGLATKQDVIDADNKLDYALISGTPTIPTKTSDLTNDSDFQTGTDVQTALNVKQDVIDANNKLAYDLLSGTPSIPTKTSDLQNDSGFITDSSLSGKQDLIDANNKLDYSLLSGTPSIPLSTSELVNDSNFATSGYVDAQDATKLDKADYVAPYRLPFNKIQGPGGTWFQEDIGATMDWSDTDIIPNDKKIDVISFVTGSENDNLVFPTLYSESTENVIKTCEVWVKMEGSCSSAQGIAAIIVPASYYIVDEDNFPTSLKGEATANESYTYHVFVIRAVPRQGTGTSLCEICYSHFVNSNISL